MKGISFNKIKKRLYKYIFFGVGILIFSMIILGNLRLQSLYGLKKISNHVWANNLGFYINNDALAWFYSYYVMGFDNLNLFINNYTGPFTYGYYALMPIIGPLQIKKFWYINPAYIDSLIPRLWGGAVATYIREIYLDGGVIFTILITILYSIVVNYIYYKSIGTNIKLNWFATYIIISYGVFSMFFNSGQIAIIQPPNIFFMIVMFYVINRYIKVE